MGSERADAIAKNALLDDLVPAVAYRAMSGRVRLAREIGARTKPRFIEIKRERRSHVPFTEEELNSIRGGLTVEEYRWKLIRQFLTE